MSSRPGKSPLRFGLALLGLSTSLGACGGKGGLGDQTAPFVGTWTYQSGMLTAVCPLLGVTNQAFPLAGLSVTLTKVDDGHVKLAAGSVGMCSVTFAVSGDKATAGGGQSCTIATDTPLADVVIGIESWTLTTASDGLASETSGKFLNDSCTAKGPGVLVRATPDGGPD